jgi:2-methylcitrate dehydratase PrpD
MNHARKASGEGVRALVHWASAIEVGDIPPAVLQKAARILADDLAAMIGARDEPEVARFHDAVLGQVRPAEATVWRGGRARTDRVSAAVANAVAADWLELDEGYRPTPCHAGLYVLPALLAYAEARDLRCDELLRALVLGYEFVTRIARSWIPSAMTMQSHGRYGAIGAAAGVGFASRLAVDPLVAALGGAATLIGPAPRNHLAEGALVRNAWPASAAWNGLMALEWAGCGIGGIAEGFYDVYSTVLGGEARPELLTAGLGERWAVLDGYTKIYACCQHLHSAVEAALDLRKGDPAVAVPGAIASISVETHPLALPLANPAPHTTLGAKFSIPHAVAAALLRGEAGASAFDAHSLTDPAIAQLRGRVASSAWTQTLSPPNDRPARVTVRLHDGRTVGAECVSARGGPDRPLPADVWVEKMNALAAPAYPAIVPVFQTLVRGDPERLAQRWTETVLDMTGSPTAGAHPQATPLETS